MIEKTANQNMRLYARRRSVALWRVAKALGVSEPTLYIRLRTPYTREQQKEFKDAVNRVAQEGK
jgi:hypothetical protein